MRNHPIFARVFHGDVAGVQKHLDADRTLVEVRDQKNLTPMHVAASRGKLEVIRLLRSYGAAIDGPTNAGEWTPLVFASYRGHLDAVELLIEKGAGVSEEDGNPIHFAGQRQHREICRALVEGGAIDDLIETADVDVVDLFRAAYSFDSDSVEQILVRRPELVDFIDRHGRTPLHEACSHGDLETVRVLLKFGADFRALDDRGQTPLDRAVAHRKHRVVKVLEEHGIA